MSKYSLKLNIKPKYYPLYSSIITAFIFLLSLALSGILGFDNKTILSGDLFSQYTAFIQLFLDTLKNGGNLYYSFSLYFGNPTSATFAYYCLSPFNLFYLIPGISVSAMTIVIITMKLSLAAASFTFFLRKAVKEHSPFIVLFGICYALSAFNAAMFIHIMWLDALYILPILILLILRYTKGSSFLPLIPAYAFLFFTNFYMGYIVGIFSGIVFLASIIAGISAFTRSDITAALKKCMGFFFSVLLSASICAAILMPAAYELFEQRSQSGTDFALVNVSIPDIFNNLFMGEMQGMGSPIPLIYCSLPCLLLLPVFFTSQRISTKEKILSAIILGFYLAGTQFLPVYRFLHAMEAPNWYAHRYAPCVVFVLLTIGCRGLSDLRSIPKTYLWKFAAAAVILYGLLIPFQRLAYPGYNTNSHGWLLLNAAFLAAYILILNLRPRFGSQVLTVLLMSEILINTCCCISRNSFGFQSENNISAWEKQEKSIISALQVEDPSFYRIRVNGEQCLNAPSRFSYPGLNTFNTVDNTRLRSTLSSLGIGTSFMTIYDHGYTDLTDMLFGVKYSLDLKSGAINGSAAALPLGFMCSQSLLSWSADSDVFTNQETLVQSMTDKDYKLYYPIGVSTNNIEYKNMELLPFDNAILFQHLSDIPANGKIIFSFPDQAGYNVLGHFTPESTPVIRPSSPEVDVPACGFQKTINLADGSIFTCTVNENNVPEAPLVFNRDGDFDYAVKDFSFVVYDPADIAKISLDLSNNTLTVSQWRDGELTGTVNASAERPILFTSIPYAKGWKAFVDNMPYDIGATVNKCFISLYLTPGEHTIKLVYEHPLADISVMISGCGVIISLLLLLWGIRKKGKQTESLNPESNV